MSLESKEALLLSFVEEEVKAIPKLLRELSKRDEPLTSLELEILANALEALNIRVFILIWKLADGYQG